MRRSVSLVSAILLAFGVSGCPKSSEQKKEETPVAKTPAAIPSDFVLNDFFGDSGPPNEPGNAASSSHTLEAQQDTPPPRATPKLLTPGNAPLVERKYALVIGRPETINVTLRSSVSEEGAGQPPAHEDQPPLTFTLVLTPRVKNEAGEFGVAMALSKAEIAPTGGAQVPQAAQLSAALHSLTGITATLKIDVHGTVGDVSITPPDPKAGRLSPEAAQFIPLLEQAFEAIVAILPAEPIGVGATWEVVTSMRENGISTVSRAVYTLKDATADTLQIAIDTTRKAPKQNVSDPRGNAALTIDGTETMTLKVKLDRMVLKGQADSTLALTVEQAAPDGGKPVTSKQKITLRQSIENAKP